MIGRAGWAWRKELTVSWAHVTVKPHSERWLLRLVGESLIIRCFHKIGILSDFYFSGVFIWHSCRLRYDREQYVNLARNYFTDCFLLGASFRGLSGTPCAMNLKLPSVTDLERLFSFDLLVIQRVLLFSIFQDWSNGHLMSQPHECSFID